MNEKQNLRSTSVQVGNTSSIKVSIARLDCSNKKFAPVLNITEAKMLSFLCVQTNLVCPGSEIL